MAPLQEKLFENKVRAIYKKIIREEQQANMVKTTIPISQLETGMTVEYNGEILTVGKNDVKKGFMGYSFRGDASKKNITRIQYRIKTANGTILR